MLSSCDHSHDSVESAAVMLFPKVAAFALLSVLLDSNRSCFETGDIKTLLINLGLNYKFDLEDQLQIQWNKLFGIW